MRKPMSALVFGVVLALAGCASASGGSGGSANGTPSTATSSVITQKQLDQFPSATAYEIIQRLHPHWLVNRTRSDLTNRGTQVVTNPSPGVNPTALQVYMGDTRLGGTEELRNYTGAQLQSIQYLDPGHATMQLGTGNPNGAIVLTRR